MAARAKAPYVHGTVSFDEGPKFSALISSTRWNGWAVPYFKEAVAMKVAKYVNANPDTYRLHILFVIGEDCFIIIDLDNPGERPTRVDFCTIDGDPYYQLAPGWTWWAD